MIGQHGAIVTLTVVKAKEDERGNVKGRVNVSEVHQKQKNAILRLALVRLFWGLTSFRLFPCGWRIVSWSFAGGQSIERRGRKIGDTPDFRAKFWFFL